MLCRFFSRTLFLLVLLHPGAGALAQENETLIFAAPPRETPEQGAAVYGPIAVAISRVLGRSVEYYHPGNWPTYTSEMRAGKYDLVFDAPHLGSWRMQHIQHEPVVRLPGSLEFVVISNNPKLTDLQQLAGRSFCALLPPNGGTLTAMYPFKDSPVRPRLVIIKGGFPAVFKALQENRCEGAVLRKPYWVTKVSPEDKQGIKVLFNSRPIPQQTITAGPRVSAAERQKIINEFTNPITAKPAAGLFQRFAKGERAFIATNPPDYTYLNLLLDGIHGGW